MPRGAFGNAVVTTLPAVSAAPLWAGATQRIVAGYAGNLFRLKRISDGTTLDVPQLADGSPDLSGVTTFLNGAAYCRVDTVYDQAGTGNHAVQATAGTMPLFRQTANVRGKYSITYDPNTNFAAMTVPTITGSSQAVTVVNMVAIDTPNNPAVIRVGDASNGISVYYGSGNASTPSNQVIVTTTGTGGSFINTTRTRIVTQPQAVAVSSGPSQIRCVSNRYISTSPTTGTATTWTGGVIGTNGTGILGGEWFGQVIYGTELEPTEMATLVNTLNGAFNAVTSEMADTLLILLGNSLVQGVGAPMCINNIRKTLPNLKKKIFICNQGVSGQTAATQSSVRATYLSEAESRYAKKLILVGDPINDILSPASVTVGSGNSVWSTYTLPDIQAYQAVFGAANVIVPTMPGHTKTQTGGSAAQYATERNAWNNQVRSNQATYGYTVVDYDSIALLQDATNTTYFYDGVHPTDLGYTLMSGLFRTALNALL